MRHFDKDGFGYKLVDDADGFVQYIDTPAVAFSYDANEKTGVLHKYGELERLEVWAEGVRRTYTAAGLPDLAQEIIVLGAKTFPVEYLNRCIDISGYVGVLYTQLLESQARQQHG